MSRDEVSDAISAAFGRPVAESGGAADVVERSVAAGFGATTGADEQVVKDLQEAGYTPAGARAVLSRLDAGSALDAAVADIFGSGVQAGKVPSLVFERAVRVLRSSGRVAEETAPATVTSTSRPIAEARDRLADAYGSAHPSFPRSSAQTYADSAVSAWLDSGTRQGWSEQQVVEALDGQRAAVVGRAQPKAVRKVVQR